MTISIGDENGIGISTQDIYVIEIRSIVKMNGLRITGLNLCCEGAIEKRSIVDNNGIGITGLKMSGLGETSSSLYCDRRP